MRSKLLSVLSLFVLLTVPLRADEPMPRTISTTGESIVFVTPDEVTVSLGVETFNADLDKSKSENDERKHRVGEGQGTGQADPEPADVEAREIRPRPIDHGSVSATC